MKVQGNDLRHGHVIEYKGKLWVVTKTQHTQPGKGGAFVQTELKGLQDNQKLKERFSVDDTLERAYMEERPFQFLFQEGDHVHLMDLETYDQVTVDADLLGDQARFLQDGMQINCELYEGTPVRAALPDTVTLEVTFAEPVIKGQTATASYKPATLENGVETMVPPHVEQGEKIVVKTADASYVERARR